MRKIILLTLSALTILIIGSVIVISNKPVNNLITYDEKTILALYNENGEKIDQVPSKDSGYTLDTEKSSCTNGSVSWNYESWSPVVAVSSEVKERVSCNLYFKEATTSDECASKYGADSIQCSILTQLDDTGACPTVNEEGNILIDNVESENGYLCSAPDDYGTSYYYRGDVTNNYVNFAGYYWRIIRINGDDSIRMIYDGTSAHANGESSTDRQSGTSEFNSLSEDPSYVGYMYGNELGVSYEKTTSNDNDSTVKAYLDNWYNINIEAKNYADYIADSGFCNDRSLSTTSTGDGVVTTTDTNYGGYQRFFELHLSTLQCPNESNDLFTTVASVKGNKALDYPIGLITVDEIQLAGAYNGLRNYNYYLYTGNYYWTMSPSHFIIGRSSASSYELAPGLNDSISSSWVGGKFGVRPVINLKANSLKSGDGTMTKPYRVS